MKIHKLLQKQLTDAGEENTPSGELSPLLAAINETYHRFVAEGLENEDHSALRKANLEMGLLFENINDVFFSVDMVDYRLLQLSGGCEKVYGYDKDTFYANPNLWFEVIVDEDKQLIENNNPLMYAGKSFQTDYRIRHATEGVKWIETKITPTLDEEGKLIRLDGLTHDITARKMAEEELINLKNRLTESELKFRLLVEKSHDGICLLSGDNKVVYISPSVTRILGYSAEELINSDALQFIDPEDLSMLLESFQKLKQAPGETLILTYRIKHKNGSWKWIRSYITDLLNEPAVNAILFNYTDITEKIEAERQLVFDRMNTEALINSTNDLMWSVDSNFRLVIANKPYKSMIKSLTGVDIQPGDEIHMAEYFPKEQLAKAKSYYARALKGESFFVEEYYEYPQKVWAEIGYYPMAENNEIVGVACFAKDITAYKQTLEKISESEKRMANAQEVAHFGSWELTTNDDPAIPDTLTWSDEVFRIFGYAPGECEVSLEKFYAAVVPEDIQKIKTAIAAAEREKSRYSVDHRIRKPDGSISWVHEDGIISFDENTGKTLKILGTIQDITKNVLATEALKLSEANLKTVFNNTNVGYILLDDQLKVVTYNSRAHTWIEKFYSGDLRNDAFLPDYFPADNILKTKDIIEKVSHGHKVSLVLKKSGKEELWYQADAFPILGETGKLHGICIAATDITERKQEELVKERMTADLVARNEGLKQFAYIVSHNLRAPVTNIMAYSEELKDDSYTPEEKKMFVDEMTKSVFRLDNVLRDLNNILEIRKSSNLRKKWVDFNILTEEILADVPAETKTEMEVIRDFTEAEGIHSVPAYCRSIFYNLISNSIKFKREGVPLQLKIKSSIEEDKLVLSFEDNGMGFDKELKKEKLFGLYNRFHDHIEGKGFGLFMTKTQVEALDGSIEVDSEVNRGTTFRISLPVK